MNHELLDQISEFNDLLTDAMNRSGVFYTVRHDMDKWFQQMATAPQIMAVNAAFDSAHSDQSRSFWIDVHDRYGEPMAMIANKLVETDDYVSMIVNGTAWYDRPGPWPVLTPRLDPVPRIAGRIHARGGLYAYPQHRKRGLAYAATRLMRSISLGNSVGWTVSVTSQAGVSRNLPIDVYGYTYCEMAFRNAPIPFFGKPVDLYLVAVSRADMTAQLSGDIEWLGMRRHEDLGQIAAAWRSAKRHDQAVEPARIAAVA